MNESGILLVNGLDLAFELGWSVEFRRVQTRFTHDTSGFVYISDFPLDPTSRFFGDEFMALLKQSIREKMKHDLRTT